MQIRHTNLYGKHPPSRLLSGSHGLPIMEMTVAGTAQDLHLIPFYAPTAPPTHHQIGCKGTKKMADSAIFPSFCVKSSKRPPGRARRSYGQENSFPGARNFLAPSRLGRFPGQQNSRDNEVKRLADEDEQKADGQQGGGTAETIDERVIDVGERRDGACHDAIDGGYHSQSEGYQGNEAG